MKLTDLAIKNLKFEGTQRRIFDDALPNFGVRLYKSGPRFIVLIGKNRKSVTLGRYPDISLKDARKKALELLQVTDRLSAEVSVSEALGDFLSHARAQNKPRTARDYERLLKRHFPQGSLQHLGKSQILPKLDALSRVPGERSHATTAFQVFLNWCVHNGYLDANPIAGLRNQGKIQRRDRVLSDDELKSVWNELSEDRFSKIVRLLILTGQRRSELPHIVIDDGVAIIPSEHTKNGREHSFPVGAYTQTIFEPIIFNGWSKAKRRLDNASGVAGWTLHDLRRTFASNHARLGTPIHVVEKMLNHVSGSFSGVTGVYQRYSYFDEMREACQRYERWLLSEVA